jgi:hypothetical protein
MSVLEYQAKARAHMKEWSPKEYARLQAEGTLQEPTHLMAVLAAAAYNLIRITKILAATA